jgi:vancomycin resistance protein VanJ
MLDSIARPPRAAARLVLFACLAYLLALAILTALLWTLADQWWPATVLSFSPRWVLATPLILLLPMALGWHRWSLLTLAAAGALLAWPIMGLHIPWAAATDDGHNPFLRVVTCNIHGRQLSAAEFKAVLDDLRPDVVALQDWSAHGREDLFPPSTWNIRRDGELLLASRYPIIQAQSITLAEPPPVDFKIRLGAAAYYRLLTPLGEVNLINLHLSSAHAALDAMRVLDPTSPVQLEYNTRCRDMESSTIVQFAATLGNPVLILGDFNTPKESNLYRLYWDRFTNAFSAAGFGFGSTHISTESSVRIDHILFGDGWRARACWIGPAAGSPHRPLVADLQRDGDSPLLDANAGR